MPHVFIIILNWNGIHHTRECLRSLETLRYPHFRVIVVDNGSSDGSTDVIRREFPGVLLIENGENLGYTGGNNIGMQRALEQGADYVWLLNNDTVVEPDTLSKLVDEAESDPAVGLVSPLVHYYDEPATVQYIAATLNFRTFTVEPVTDLVQLQDQSLAGRLVLYGTALFVSARLMHRVGYLAANYFAYQEDFDYSLRALACGFRTRVRCDARILHKESQTTGKHSPLHVFLMTRNAYFLWRDNYIGLTRLVAPWRYVGSMIGHMKWLVDSGKTDLLNACRSGIWSALRGRGGAYDPRAMAPAWFSALLDFFVSWHPYLWVQLFKGDLKGLLRDLLNRTRLVFIRPT